MFGWTLWGRRGRRGKPPKFKAWHKVLAQVNFGEAEFHNLCQWVQTLASISLRECVRGVYFAVPKGLSLDMSKKRQREVKATDTKLIEIYDDLANDDEEIRLKAAYALLSRFSANTTIDQHKNILKRLFRGLCSGRKAARLGFSVALTEFLSQVILAYIDGEEIEVLEIVDLLESQTAVDGSTSGQVGQSASSLYV